MPTAEIYRFEDDNGRSRFGSYYLLYKIMNEGDYDEELSLPGPGDRSGSDPVLFDAWNAHRNPEGECKFAFASIRQARRYMDVDRAIENGHLKRLTLPLGSVLFCETQCIYDEYAVTSVQLVEEG